MKLCHHSCKMLMCQPKSIVLTCKGPKLESEPLYLYSCILSPQLGFKYLSTKSKFDILTTNVGGLEPAVVAQWSKAYAISQLIVATEGPRFKSCTKDVYIWYRIAVNLQTYSCYPINVSYGDQIWIQPLLRACP